MFEKRFGEICDKIVDVIKAFTGVLLFIMLLVVMFQVVWRNILSLASPWTEEVTTYLITYITFIGGVAVMIKGEHLAIDLVTEHVSSRSKDLFQILYNLIFTFVSVWIFVYGMKLCLSPLIQNQTSIATGIPRVYVYGIMPVSMFFCGVYCIFKIFFLIRNILTGKSEYGRGE